MISDKILPINDEYIYSALKGEFFIYNKGKFPHKYECRESFHYRADRLFRPSSFVGFAKNKLNVLKINEFFEILEDKLRIQDKTIVFYTDNKRYVVLKPSPFWSKTQPNKQLFTLFLRCAAKHYNGDFDKALHNYYYTRVITPVIKALFKGYKFTFKVCYGIMDKFASYRDGYSNRMLINKDWKKYLTK